MKESSKLFNWKGLWLFSTSIAGVDVSMQSERKELLRAWYCQAAQKASIDAVFRGSHGTFPISVFERPICPDALKPGRLEKRLSLSIFGLCRCAQFVRVTKVAQT